MAWNLYQDVVGSSRPSVLLLAAGGTHGGAANVYNKPVV